MTTSPTKAAGASELARLGLAPIGLSRLQAAAYIGVSVSLFDLMVRDGRMPPAKRIEGRLVWDRARLDKAFEAIPDGEGAAEIDDVWGRAAV